MIDIDMSISKLLADKKSQYPEKLIQAMEYALFPAGKRIRPQLMLMSAKFLGAEEEKIEPLAVAIELIHNYSLIHDDLPGMDDDAVRRNKPSCHKAFGEAMAILAGDALLNLAYEILLEGTEKYPEIGMAALYLAKCAGGEGMIGGQAIEFSFEADAFDDMLVTELCMKKTGALIKAAVMCPTFTVFDREKTNSLSAYADAVGLAFQLKDDLLDGDKNEPKSYLTVNGKEKTLLMLEKSGKIAEKALSKWTEGTELIEFSKQLINRTK